MPKKKPGLVLYYDDLEDLAVLSDAQLGALIRALAFGGDVPDDLAVAFSMLNRKKIRDEERYAETCEANRRNANARWSRGRTYAIAYDGMQTDADAGERMRNMPIGIGKGIGTGTSPNNKNKKEEKASAEEVDRLVEEAKRAGVIKGTQMEATRFRFLVEKYGAQAVGVGLASAHTYFELVELLGGGADASAG